MTQYRTLTRAPLKTPKAAAIAGIIFSFLLITVFWLLRISVPRDPLVFGSWLADYSTTVALAMNLVPFAGIAFLWFIGVLRDRIGQAEDQFFATVFLGSGLLYLSMLFSAAAFIGAIMVVSYSQPKELIGSPTFYFARAAIYSIVNIYLTKMASVFMLTTSTVAIFTRFIPRWLAFFGYSMALLLLFGSYYIDWGFIVFPLWVLVVSICILTENVR